MQMLHPESEYYLHVNGTVHYKPLGHVEPDSPFVKEVWNANVIGKTPETYLNWLRELKMLGALDSEIRRLVKKQNLTDYIPEAMEQLSLEDKDEHTDQH